LQQALEFLLYHIEMVVFLSVLAEQGSICKSSQPIRDLLPHCYQDRANQPHLAPCQEHPLLWFFVGFGCLRLDSRNFVNRRSLVRFQSPAPAPSLSFFSPPMVAQR